MIVVYVSLVILCVCLGWTMRTDWDDHTLREAQRLRDEAWDLAHGLPRRKTSP